MIIIAGFSHYHKIDSLILNNEKEVEKLAHPTF